jgi:hypothetical protein
LCMASERLRKAMSPVAAQPPRQERSSRSQVHFASSLMLSSREVDHTLECDRLSTSTVAIRPAKRERHPWKLTCEADLQPRSRPGRLNTSAGRPRHACSRRAPDARRLCARSCIHFVTWAAGAGLPAGCAHVCLIRCPRYLECAPPGARRVPNALPAPVCDPCT